jgi:hypothetical protein
VRGKQLGGGQGGIELAVDRRGHQQIAQTLWTVQGGGKARIDKKQLRQRVEHIPHCLRQIGQDGLGVVEQLPGRFRREMKR